MGRRRLLLLPALAVALALAAGCAVATHGRRPADQSGEVERRIGDAFGGSVSSIETTLVNQSFYGDFPVQSHGSRWGYRATWWLRGTDIQVDAWFDNPSDVKKGHPALPVSSGLTRPEYVSVLKAAADGTWHYTFGGVWKATDFSHEQTAARPYNNLALKDLYVAGDYQGSFGPPAKATSVIDGWVVLLDPVTRQATYIGPSRSVIPASK